MDSCERYASHIALIGESGQKALQEARILCVGAGGLGCPALLYLSAAGVGTIGVIDFDTVDWSNLQRQILFKEEDVFKSKAECAKASLWRTNSSINYHVYTEQLNSQNVSFLFQKYDIVIDGTDNLSTKYLINDCAVQCAKPVVYGAISKFEGQVAIFDVNHGPCYRCLFPECSFVNNTPNCTEIGVIGALPGMIGSMQALEAIKYILKDIHTNHQFYPLIGKLWQINALTMAVSIFNIPVRQNCQCRYPNKIRLINYPPICSWNSTEIKTIDPTSLKLFENVLFIDVRELEEWRKGHINNAINLPLSHLPYAANQLKQEDKNKIIIVYCQRGNRSQIAIPLLQQIGFKEIYHLAGGLDNWTQLIETPVEQLCSTDE
ncbi:HesA/MoeB/ThiF family protein [Coxiella endosymbiont of Amblyomma nuttalli]|uniref:HesA/MoeB/ThiF family protein n=1 Tax=Coxiella endosymbiont of Amblyomma nuttalli TaxID=2749996 RepID=UPI001BAAEA9E|nr:HesA/MoeB/ThiF family protein [Coxiella endosymbiont of Amblyomma nuttalli]QTS83980.1 putative adenylyltransferase/sulfurtransferase MoeZ [Coxiella endosymbiont of Amblyomma nuttalli]